MIRLTRKEATVLKEGLWSGNPVTFQVLGVCSALAVTVKVETALLMGFGLTFVAAGSSLIVSLLREFIPSRIRIIIQILVVSVLVITVDQLLRAFFYAASKQMSVFVGLIITNCIVMGRVEGYAMTNPPRRAFLDGLANGLGYAAVLVLIAVVRELAGSGTILATAVLPQELYQNGYANNGLMVLAPGAFFLLGLLVWLQRALSGYREK